MILFDRSKYFIRAVLPGFAAVLILLVSPHAQAELILGAEVRITAEDNIVGLLSGSGGPTGSTSGTMGGSVMQAGGMGFGGGAGGGTGSGAGKYTGSGSLSPSDISVTTSAELGGMTEGGRLVFFAMGFAERTDYQTYSEYDSSIAGVTAGMTVLTRGILSLQIAGFDKIKRYDNNPFRDGTEYGGSASLKQLVTDKLWLREGAEYDTYRAAGQAFSYRGAIYRFTSGYDLTDDLLMTAGYSFQAQQYQDSAATALRTRTALLGMDYALTYHWSTELLYERQTTEAGTSDVVTRNNIFSFAVRWDY